MTEQADNTLDVTEVATLEAPMDDLAFHVYLSEDRASVLMDHPDPLADFENTISHLLLDLEKLDLPEEPDQAQLETMIRDAARPGEPFVAHVLVMAKPPVPSRDGEIEWDRDFFATGWVIDEDSDTIDFWQRAEHRCVKENDLLVTVTPSVTGEAGIDVFGNKIDVAKPEPVKLRAGKGVRIEENDGVTAYFAEINGRVCHADDVVSVDDLLMLPEVSLATGNVKHTGSVMVDGDVRHGARVEVDGDIAIKGLVEQCELHCGGSLTVAGGIIGDPEQEIIVGGDLEARYIKEAVLSVHGDVTVTGEIDHCQIRATGTVDVSGGRISGGSITAYRGIKVGEAGASGSGVTKLISGVDFSREQALAEHKAEIKRLERRTEILETILRHGAAMEKEQLRGLTTVVKDIMQRRRQMKDALDEARVKLETFRSEADSRAIMQVVILREIWSGTVIQLGDESTKVIKTYDQPRLARIINHKVRVVPLGEENMPSF